MSQLILTICIIAVVVICFYLTAKQINSLYIKHQKLIEKLNQIDEKLNKIDAFLIPTYNNSIRISKKLNVYYQYNKDDYKQHKEQQ